MIKKQYDTAVKLAEKLLDASIDRVLAIDTEWKIIAWNHTMEMDSGLSKQQVMGKNLMEIFPQLQQDTDRVSAFEFAFQGKKSFLPARAGAFNRSHHENHFIPLLNEEGHIIGVMNLLHDVAHRIKAERQLQQLNAELKDKYNQLEKANAELATFTAITGNDLKEPIKKVYTSLELIMMNDAPRMSDSSKAGLRRMQASLNRIKLLLDDILAISTVNSFNGDYQTVDLNQVISAVQMSMRNKIKERRAVIDVQSLPTVTGSEQMLHNLFLNLLDNALKFQPYGNTPRISIFATTVPVRSSPALIDNFREYACISVADNGIGFSQADAEKIFIMFERLHPRSDYAGSGIGLTICRKIVEAHGGYMQAESIPGQGTTFRCYLPLKPNE